MHAAELDNYFYIYIYIYVYIGSAAWAQPYDMANDGGIFQHLLIGARGLQGQTGEIIF